MKRRWVLELDAKQSMHIDLHSKRLGAKEADSAVPCVLKARWLVVLGAVLGVFHLAEDVAFIGDGFQGLGDADDAAQKLGDLLLCRQNVRLLGGFLLAVATSHRAYGDVAILVVLKHEDILQ